MRSFVAMMGMPMYMRMCMCMPFRARKSDENTL